MEDDLYKTIEEMNFASLVTKMQCEDSELSDSEVTFVLKYLTENFELCDNKSTIVRFLTHTSFVSDIISQFLTETPERQNQSLVFLITFMKSNSFAVLALSCGFWSLLPFISENYSYELILIINIFMQKDHSMIENLLFQLKELPFPDPLEQQDENICFDIITAFTKIIDYFATEESAFKEDLWQNIIDYLNQLFGNEQFRIPILLRCFSNENVFISLDLQYMNESYDDYVSQEPYQLLNSLIQKKYSETEIDKKNLIERFDMLSRILPFQYKKAIILFLLSVNGNETGKITMDEIQPAEMMSIIFDSFSYFYVDNDVIPSLNIYLGIGSLSSLGYIPERTEEELTNYFASIQEEQKNNFAQFIATIDDYIFNNESDPFIDEFQQLSELLANHIGRE